VYRYGYDTVEVMIDVLAPMDRYPPAGGSIDQEGDDGGKRLSQHVCFRTIWYSECEYYIMTCLTFIHYRCDVVVVLSSSRMEELFRTASVGFANTDNGQ
jgi:hypothetical protein